MGLTIDLPKYLLVLGRVASVMWLLPLFSMRGISVYYKVGLSLLISYLLVNFVTLGPLQSDSPYFFLLAIAREVLIGLALGFSVRVLFAMVQAAGEVISLQSGFAFARIMDPVSSAQSSILEEFLYILGMMVFFAVDAHHMVIRALHSSFSELPLGSATIMKGLVYHFITISGKIFSLGLKIGAPVIVALFLIELSLGLLSRMLPQMNIFVEGLPVKVFVAFSILAFSLSFIVPALDDLFRSIGPEAFRIFKLMV